MKKTAIVSCYFYHNYGSMLQAYATQQVLDKLNIKNETINVSAFLKDVQKKQMKYLAKSVFTSDVLKTKGGKAKNILVKKILKNNYTRNIGKRDLEFDKFKDKYIRLSEQYPSVKALAQKCSQKYDAVVLGSDQLWLPGNIAADYYTLNFVPENINSIAYATSFGVSELPKNIEKMAASFLRRIRHISVREIDGAKIIENTIDRKIPVVCDPTLLFTGEEWTGMLSETLAGEEPYIFCYYIGNCEAHREFVKRLKKKTGYKVIALPHIDHFVNCDEGYADETPYDIGPDGFVNLIRNAQYVCTDSFHCSVFSILYRREFFAFRRFTQKTKQSTNNRLDTLFEIAGIQNRMLKGDEPIEECIKMHIDYDNVHSRLEEIRKKSYSYLETALLDTCSTDIK